MASISAITDLADGRIGRGFPHQAQSGGREPSGVEWDIAATKAPMLRFVLVPFATMAVAALACAQEAPAPTLHAGDKWVYQIKSETPAAGATTRHWEGMIERVGTGSMVLGVKPADSNLPARERMVQDDWSNQQSVNGKTMTVSKNFDFPLKPGKTWRLDVTRDRPNPQLVSLRNTLDYKVLGWEDVTVPAGTFHVLKIEAEGEWHKEFAPTNASASTASQAGATGSMAVVQTRASTVPQPLTGRFYRAIWYAPEARREVKSVYEDFDAAGTLLHRETDDLESYQVQP